MPLYDYCCLQGISLEFTDTLAIFRTSARRNPDGDAIRYFGGRITARARGRPAAGKCRARVRK
jgi:hypothetical protein